MNVTLPEAFWHLKVDALLLVIENDEPEPLVGMVTAPSQLPLPVPSATCSLLERNLPDRASTYTDWIEACPWSRPLTRVSQARWEVLPCHTTRRGASELRTLSTCCRATLVARPLSTRGVVEVSLILLVCATEVASTWPSSSVTTTKSPPTTGRPRQVRS